MARETRRGPIATPASNAGLSHREAREQVKLKKRRKKHESEEAKKKKDGSSGNDRISRSQTMEIVALHPDAPVEVAPLSAPAPSPQPTKRRTRQDTPACTDFGTVRHALFNKPNLKFFFCSPCDAWDNDEHVLPNIDQSSRRCRCVAQHASCIFPTAPFRAKGLKIDQLKDQPRRGVGFSRRLLDFNDSGSTRMEMEESDDETVDAVSVTQVDPSTCAVDQLISAVALQQVENATLRAQISESKNTVVSLRRRIRHLECKPTEKATSEEPSETDDLPCLPAVKSGRKKADSENGWFHKDITRMLNGLVAARGWGGCQGRKRVSQSSL
jgi:hypothetical protein